MSWKTTRLDEVAEVRLGRQRSPKNHTGSQMRPYLRAANVSWDGLALDDVKTMNFTDLEMETYRLRFGDILLSEASGSPGEVGKPALWREELSDCAFQNTLIRVRPQRHLPEFLLYFFRYAALSGQFKPASRGVGINHLGRGRLAAWRTPWLSISEQRRIVEIVEDHLFHLDAADAALALARQRASSLRHQLLFGSITGMGDEGPRTSEITAAECVDGRLPSIPEDWSWQRLGDVAEVVGGVTKDAKKQADPTYVEVPYLRVANVQRASLSLGNVSTIRVPAVKAEALRLQRGDLLLNEGGDRDKLARGWVWENQIPDCIHQNHVFRARLHADLNPYFTAWAANLIGGPWAERNGKQSVNLASISLRMIKRLPVPVPPRSVADRAADRIRDELVELARVDDSIQVALSRNKALRRAVLAAAFSGRLAGASSDSEVIGEMMQA